MFTDEAFPLSGGISKPLPRIDSTYRSRRFEYMYIYRLLNTHAGNSYKNGFQSVYELANREEGTNLKFVNDPICGNKKALFQVFERNANLYKTRTTLKQVDLRLPTNDISIRPDVVKLLNDIENLHYDVKERHLVDFQAEISEFKIKCKAYIRKVVPLLDRYDVDEFIYHVRDGVPLRADFVDMEKQTYIYQLIREIHISESIHLLLQWALKGCGEKARRKKFKLLPGKLHFLKNALPPDDLAKIFLYVKDKSPPRDPAEVASSWRKTILNCFAYTNIITTTWEQNISEVEQ